MVYEKWKIKTGKMKNGTWKIKKGKMNQQKKIYMEIFLKINKIFIFNYISVIFHPI
jgi:hypothetical protein